MHAVVLDRRPPRGAVVCRRRVDRQLVGTGVVLRKRADPPSARRPAIRRRPRAQPSAANVGRRPLCGAAALARAPGCPQPTLALRRGGSVVAAATVRAHPRRRPDGADSLTVVVAARRPTPRPANPLMAVTAISAARRPVAQVELILENLLSLKEN